MQPAPLFFAKKIVRPRGAPPAAIRRIPCTSSLPPAPPSRRFPACPYLCRLGAALLGSFTTSRRAGLRSPTDEPCPRRHRHTWHTGAAAAPARASRIRRRPAATKPLPGDTALGRVPRVGFLRPAPPFHKNFPHLNPGGRGGGARRWTGTSIPPP